MRGSIIIDESKACLRIVDIERHTCKVWSACITVDVY